MVGGVEATTSPNSPGDRILAIRLSDGSPPLASPPLPVLFPLRYGWKHLLRTGGVAVAWCSVPYTDTHSPFSPIDEVHLLPAAWCGGAPSGAWDWKSESRGVRSE